MTTPPKRLPVPGKRLFLMLLAALLLVISLGNPALNLRRSTYDFIFVLDITGSMNVADAGPNDAGLKRLSFAKQLVSEALGEMPCGSSAGLAVFTEHRTFLLFAPVEICENHLVVSTMLDRIDWRMAWDARSEVAKGLFSGIDTIRKLAEIDRDGSAGDTHLVFMTDGHEAPPVNRTFPPKFRGQAGEISGLIAGIGGSVPVPIPFFDEDNQVIGYWEHDDVLQVDRYSLGRPSTEGGEAMVGIDPSEVQERIARGTEHLSSLRETYLQQLAAETGLDYLHTTTREAFARALLDSRFARRQPAVTNVAWIPAALSFLCLMYLFGLQILRNRAAISGDPRRSLPDILRGDTVPRSREQHQ